MNNNSDSKYKINQVPFHSYVIDGVEHPDGFKKEIVEFSKDLHERIERDLMNYLSRSISNTFAKSETPTYPSKLTAQQYNPPSYPYISTRFETLPSGFYAHKFDITGS